MTDWAYTVSKGDESKLEVNDYTITIPEGEEVNTLTVTDVPELVVHGDLKRLEGSVEHLSGMGEVEHIENASIRAIDCKDIGRVDDSSIHLVSSSYIATVSGSTIEGLFGSAHIEHLSNSKVANMHDNSYIWRTQHSSLSSMRNHSRISFLMNDSYVSHALHSAVIDHVGRRSSIGLVEDEAVINENFGVVYVARHDAVIINRGGGFVDYHSDGVLVVDRPFSESCSVSVAEQCRRNSNGNLLVYKVADKDGITGQGYNKPTHWKVGETVTCDDWSAEPVCGYGLHVSATIADALRNCDINWNEGRFFLCEVDPETLVTITDRKAKAPSVHVVAEVDQTGTPL